MKNNQPKKAFKKYLQEIKSPNYQGGSWTLPENPTPLEQAKYEICQKVIRHKRNSKLTTEKLAQKIQLSKAETEDILYCRIDYFTLVKEVDSSQKRSIITSSDHLRQSCSYTPIVQRTEEEKELREEIR
ncbi:14883_t:CDS:2, partial [Funneliformis geosporum]